MPLAAGMVLSAVNTFGGLDGDKARFLGAFSRFLPVGLLQGLSHQTAVSLRERLFRYLTGLGTVDLNTPRLGARPSNIALRCTGDRCRTIRLGGRARAAAAQGATVVIVDENARAAAAAATSRELRSRRCWPKSARSRVSVCSPVPAPPRITPITGCRW